MLVAETLKPFTQQGVRSALIMILMIAISASLIADPNTAAVGAPVNVVLGLLVAGVLLYLSLRDIHLRIVDAKMQVLKPLRQKFNQQPQNLLT